MKEIICYSDSSIETKLSYLVQEVDKINSKLPSNELQLQVDEILKTMLGGFVGDGTEEDTMEYFYDNRALLEKYLYEKYGENGVVK
jgi:hypothetical protein